MGGVWERVICSVKKIVRDLLREQLVSGEVLKSLLLEVKGILNSRPLTHTVMIHLTEPLTPYHLFLLRSGLQKRYFVIPYLADIVHYFQVHLPQFKLK